MTPRSRASALGKPWRSNGKLTLAESFRRRSQSQKGIPGLSAKAAPAARSDAETGQRVKSSPSLVGRGRLA